MQFAAVIAIPGGVFFFQTDLRLPRNQKKGRKKPVVFGKQAAHTCFAPCQTYVTIRGQVLGSTPLLSKYCPVVPEVKTGKPTYPLGRLCLLLLCCSSQKNSACWIVHSNQVCGVFYIKRYHRRRSRHNVVQMHGTIREDRTSPSNPTWTGHRWSATCDREFTIVVHNIVMSQGSSHIHATQNTKQTRCCLLYTSPSPRD